MRDPSIAAPPDIDSVTTPAHARHVAATLYRRGQRQLASGFMARALFLELADGSIASPTPDRTAPVVDLAQWRARRRR